jgi:hypothetical protein
VKNRYKEGDKVYLKKSSRDYTGQYAGTEVTIKKIDTDLHCTVTGFDGKNFMCPYSYFEEDDFLTWMYDAPECVCGAWKTWGKSCPAYFHSDFCPIYRPKKDD